MNEVKTVPRFIGPYMSDKGQYVRASDYDAALSQLAALREELDRVSQSWHDMKQQNDDIKQRLADAERRNVSLLEIARGLTIQLHATIGNTELHEDCIRDLKDLEAKNE